MSSQPGDPLSTEPQLEGQPRPLAESCCATCPKKCRSCSNGVVLMSYESGRFCALALLAVLMLTVCAWLYFFITSTMTELQEAGYHVQFNPLDGCLQKFVTANRAAEAKMMADSRIVIGILTQQEMEKSCNLLHPTEKRVITYADLYKGVCTKLAEYEVVVLIGVLYNQLTFTTLYLLYQQYPAYCCCGLLGLALGLKRVYGFLVGVSMRRSRRKRSATEVKEPGYRNAPAAAQTVPPKQPIAPVQQGRQQVSRPEPTAPQPQDIRPQPVESHQQNSRPQPSAPQPSAPQYQPRQEEPEFGIKYPSMEGANLQSSGRALASAQSRSPLPAPVVSAPSTDSEVTVYTPRTSRHSSRRSSRHNSPGAIDDAFQAAVSRQFARMVRQACSDDA